MNADTTTSTVIEPVTLSEVLEIATWDRPRSDEELKSFRARHEATVGTLDLDELLA